MIDTSSSQKTLLKQHESDIIDLKFSPIMENIFCSINNGTDENKKHVIFSSIHSPQQGDDLTILDLASYCFPASMQCGHPTNKSLWAIGYKNQIGFINNEFIYDGVSSSEYQYNKLPFHIDIPSSEGVVTDFLFNDIGTVLLVVLRNNHGSTIHFYDLPDFNMVPYNKVGVTCGYTNKHTVALPFPVVSVVLVAGHLVTVSIDTAASTTTSCNVIFHVWSCDIDVISPFNYIQNLSIKFPYASQYDHTLDDVVHVKTGAMRNNLLVVRYIVNS